MLPGLVNKHKRLAFQILSILLSASHSVIADFTNDFSDYPAAAQSCLYKASNSSDCHGDTSLQMNECLCANGGSFVTNSARCIAEDDSGDMASTWEIMSSHCSDSNTPLSVDEDAWMAYQASVVTGSITSNPTSSPTSAQNQQSTTATPASATTPDVHSSEPSTGLSSGARIGIIAGSVVAGVAIVVLALILWLRYRRKRQNAGENLPMLLSDQPRQDFNGGTRSSAHPSHVSWGPSELESPPSVTSPIATSWGRSSDGSQVPWSPSAFGSLQHTPPALGPLGGLAHQSPQREDVYELPTETVMSSYPSPPSEMPTISVTSPTVSPTSRYSGADWDMEPSQPRRYEPFRPR